jgi:hypothetical protein
MFRNVLLAALLLSLTSHCSPCRAQEKSSGVDTSTVASPAPRKATLNPEELIDRIFAREQYINAATLSYTPLVETYIQQTRKDLTLGLVPVMDRYFLGQADFARRIRIRPIVEHPRTGNLLWSFQPDGFLYMIFLDLGGFQKANYKLEYLRREFLGEVRCYVFDVAPTKKSHGAHFLGRIWVEDEELTVVRFNGSYQPDRRVSLPSLIEDHWFHFDSWRTNVKPGLWLPSYIYIQEINKQDDFIVPEFKAQTRLWGYSQNARSREEEFTRILLETSSPVIDESSRKDYSPVEADREWRREAERNVLDHLERDALLAPPGPVDTVLDTIVNNIVLTNHLEDTLDLHCRVLLTGNLELFSLENTIVVSRGLLDVVPDEATLAALLSQEIADAMIPKPYQSRYAFSDTVRINVTEVMSKLSFRDNKEELAQIQAKSFELLQNSPYKGKLLAAGLFLEQLHTQAKSLPQLVSSRLGNRIQLANQIAAAAPPLERANIDQIAALPVGSRVRLDAWSDQIALMKTAKVAPVSAGEKLPLEVAPLRPFLTRFQQTAASSASPDATAAQKN